MILRRLFVVALCLGAATPLVSASAPVAGSLRAPGAAVTATMHLTGLARPGGAVDWRVADVTYHTTGSSHAVAGATPFAASLAVTVQNALAWGTVYPGAPDRIQTNGAPAGDVLGIFKLTGSGIKTKPSVRDQFQCYFGFPTTANSLAPVATMPVTFAEAGYTYGGTSPNPTPPGTAVDLTQYSSVANPYINRLTGTGYTFYFFVGGKANPSASQAAGSYTTSISITCALTGL